MTPVNHPNMTDAEAEYNRLMLRVRNLIERCIGVLKLRFRCILGERKLRYHPTRAALIFYSCVTLHNFLIRNNFDIMHDIDQADLGNLINNNGNQHVPNPQQNRLEAIALRNQLIAHLNA